eukprot:gene32127-36079_t
MVFTDAVLLHFDPNALDGDDDTYAYWSKQWYKVRPGGQRDTPVSHSLVRGVLLDNACKVAAKYGVDAGQRYLRIATCVTLFGVRDDRDDWRHRKTHVTFLARIITARTPGGVPVTHMKRTGDWDGAVKTKACSFAAAVTQKSRSNYDSKIRGTKRHRIGHGDVGDNVRPLAKRPAPWDYPLP